MLWAAARMLHPSSLMRTDGAPPNASAVVLKQDSALIAVIELSLTSWLVAGSVPLSASP
jgi:hypothetical protein